VVTVYVSVNSDFVVREDPESLILYNSKNGETIEAEKELLDILRKCDGTRPFETFDREIMSAFTEHGIVALSEKRAKHDTDFRTSQLTPPARVAFIELTTECNLSCKHCYVPGGKPREDELSTRGFINLIDDLKKVGVLEVCFTGGEPLLQKDFLKIVKHARDQRLGVGLLTNGTLITKKMAEELAKLSIMRVRISVDGLTKEVNDSLRNKGFEKALDAIKSLLDEGLYVEVNTVMCKPNLSQISGIYDMCKKMGVSRFFTDAIIVAGRAANQDLGISYEEYRKTIKSLLKTGNVPLDKAFPREFAGEANSCGMCDSSISIKSNGDIVPCLGFQNWVLGNIKKQDIKDIWEDKKFNEVRESMDFRNIEECASCYARETCKGGCRTRSFVVKGGAGYPDPFMCVLHDVPLKR
jgi:radical SAM protein with 4Fe4S-binding SPASM domain